MEGTTSSSDNSNSGNSNSNSGNNHGPVTKTNSGDDDVTNNHSKASSNIRYTNNDSSSESYNSRTSNTHNKDSSFVNKFTKDYSPSHATTTIPNDKQDDSLEGSESDNNGIFIHNDLHNTTFKNNNLDTNPATGETNTLTLNDPKANNGTKSKRQIGDR
jgi:hypothetical protein